MQNRRPAPFPTKSSSSRRFIAVLSSLILLVSCGVGEAGERFVFVRGGEIFVAEPGGEPEHIGDEVSIGIDPRISPDGRWIAAVNLQASARNVPMLALYDMDRRDVEMFRVDGGTGKVEWAPDSRRFLHASTSGIAVVDVESGRTRLIPIESTTDSVTIRALPPFWAHDGLSIYYMEHRMLPREEMLLAIKEGRPYSAVSLVRIDTNGVVLDRSLVRPFVGAPADSIVNVEEGTLTFSDDGRSILYIAIRRLRYGKTDWSGFSRRNAAALLDLESGSVRILTPPDFQVLHARFLGDSSIIFTAFDELKPEKERDSAAPKGREHADDLYDIYTVDPSGKKSHEARRIHGTLRLRDTPILRRSPTVNDSGDERSDSTESSAAHENFRSNPNPR